VVWGRNDPIFSSDGVETIRKLNPQSEVHLYDASHFALDEQSDDIARRIIAFFAH
jgi:pimeloyl-ACP methyl ester carboxylesterase